MTRDTAIADFFGECSPLKIAFEMRAPSRHMPKYLRRRLGVGGWVTLAVVALGLIWATYGLYDVGRNLASIYGVVVAAALVGLPMMAIVAGQVTVTRNRAKIRALARSREGDSICEFARSFDVRRVDPWVIRAVYEQLQEQLSDVRANFPISADDKLVADLGLDGDAFSFDLIPEIASRTQRSLEGLSTNPYWEKITTVRDLVLCFNLQPMSENVIENGLGRGIDRPE